MIKKRVASIPWFRIMRALLPLLKTAAEGIMAAKEVDSESGRKISRYEWENILYTLFMDAIPQLAADMEKEEI